MGHLVETLSWQMGLFAFESRSHDTYSCATHCEFGVNVTPLTSLRDDLLTLVGLELGYRLLGSG